MTNEVPNQDYIEQLLDMQQNYGTDPTAASSSSGGGGGGGGGSGSHMMPHLHPRSPLSGVFHAPPQPLFHQQQPLLGLCLDQAQSHCGGGGPSFFKLDPFSSSTPNSNYVFHGQPVPSPVPMAPHQPAVRPRVRARRGQATDPHSIAERLRRERIAERIRALQELLPSVNKTDKAVMLDEIVDYVKFLRLQVKVLSMSRLGGAGAVVPLVTDTPISSVEEEVGEGGQGQPVWEKLSNDGTEGQVAKLMEENVGAAMQFLQSKALCIMPVSLASAMYHSHPQDGSSLIKPESNPPL